MDMEKIRGEKVPSNPIPENKYERFKYRLEEKSGKCSDRNLMLFYLGVATGYRMQDLTNLTIGEIKEALEVEEFEIQEQKQYKSWIRHMRDNPLSTRKAHKKRKAIIKPNLRKLLKAYVKGKHKSDYAFKSSKGDGPITPKAYSNKLSEVGTSIGLKNISGHSLRKTYATRVYEATRDLEKVRKALGHKSIETTKQYLGVEEEVREEAAKISDDKL